MTEIQESANGACPLCGAMRRKVHTFLSDFAVCVACGDRAAIEYGAGS